jgi:membrane protease subunit (stomatin/prohibitin family)
MANGNGKKEHAPHLDDPKLSMVLVIRMDPKTRAVQLGGNILVDRPTCMMMLKEAEIGIIDYHREQGNKKIEVEKSPLVSLDRSLGL